MRCFITNRECKYDGRQVIHEHQPEPAVFMISPFGFPFDDLYRLGIQKSIGEKHISRADQSLQLGYVMCQRICRRILEATHVLVDLTEPNGNVFYEFGLAYGLGKRIVLLWNERSHNQYLEAFRDIAHPKLCYRKVADVRSAPLRDYLASAFRLSDDMVKLLRSNPPHLTLGEPPVILNVVNEDCPAIDLHEEAARTAIDSYNSKKSDPDRLEQWRVDTLVIGRHFDRDKAVRRLAQAKVCLVDMTHYEEKANGHIFFLLGVAHATGREVIPIINRPLNRNIPFDIRGLWQINFEAAEELERELEQILPTIDADFKKEKEDYLYHQIWDQFLTRKSIRVITCARQASHSEDRGKRTNIDMWDFTSVSELSFFIAQKFETATVATRQPKNKRSAAELRPPGIRQGYHGQLTEDLRGQDCVIIGSPDVSDYAELALSTLYGLEPHTTGAAPSRLPYVFIKRTRGINHPRRQSAFYRIPTEKQKEGVRFGRSHSLSIDCSEIRDDDQDGDSFIGHTCVVITIAKNPFQRTGDKAEHYIVILSGFTGVATYAAVKFLTSSEPRYRAALEKYFKRREEKKPRDGEEVVGVNMLLSVDYIKRHDHRRTGDTRELTALEFRELEFIYASDALPHRARPSARPLAAQPAPSARTSPPAPAHPRSAKSAAARKPPAAHSAAAATAPPPSSPIHPSGARTR